MSLARRGRECPSDANRGALPSQHGRHLNGGFSVPAAHRRESRNPPHIVGVVWIIAARNGHPLPCGPHSAYVMLIMISWHDRIARTLRRRGFRLPGFRPDQIVEKNRAPSRGIFREKPVRHVIIVS